MSPGVPVMKSYNMVDWKMVNYVYDRLEDDDERALKNGKNDYGKGSWAESLRYDEEVNRFFVSFSCESTNCTYFYSTDNIESGAWTKTKIDKKLYDGSMYFEKIGDEYKRYYFWAEAVWRDNANGDGTHRENRVHMTELFLNDDYSFSLGEDTVLMESGNLETPPQGQPGEGYHAYHIGNYYYIIMIQGNGAQRQEICWRKKTLDNVDDPTVTASEDTIVRNGWEGKKILGGQIIKEDGSLYLVRNGIAQGGIIEGIDGKWYGFQFQDVNSAGRAPLLMPLTWTDGWSMLGNDGKTVNFIYDIPKSEYNVDGGFIEDDEFDNGSRIHYYDNDPDSYGTVTAGITAEELEELSGKPAENMIDDGNFSSGTGSWFCRGGASCEQEDGALKVSNRGSFWEGAETRWFACPRIT